MSTIEERVRKIIIEQLGVKEEEVKSEASFVDDLGADSLDTVELSWLLKKNLTLRSLMKKLKRLPLFSLLLITLTLIKTRKFLKTVPSGPFLFKNNHLLIIVGGQCV